MKRIENLLKTYEVWALKNELRVVREPPWSRGAMEEAEHKFGACLPPAYVDFVTGHGPFQIIDKKENAWGFISPEKSIEYIGEFAQACLDETDPEDAEDEDSRAWIREAQIRQRLYPFLLPDSSVHDFQCFYADKCKGNDLLIVSVRHDDHELSDWLPWTDEMPQPFDAFLAQQLSIPTAE